MVVRLADREAVVALVELQVGVVRVKEEAMEAVEATLATVRVG